MRKTIKKRVNYARYVQRLIEAGELPADATKDAHDPHCPFRVSGARCDCCADEDALRAAVRKAAQ